MTDPALAAVANEEPRERRQIADTEFVSAKTHANLIADACIAAFWLESYGPNAVRYRREAAERHLHDLAALFGFDLVAK